MNYDLSDDAALDRLLDAIEAGETALSAPFGLPAGVGRLLGAVGTGVCVATHLAAGLDRVAAGRRGW